MDSGRLQPALLGGLFIGVLSALPVVNMGNCCCCLWVVAGGALAVYLRQQNTGYAISAAEGALMGLIAGALGGIVSSVIGVFTGPLQLGWVASMMERAGNVPPEAREALERAQLGATGAGAVAGAFFSVVIYSVFGLLGGLLGVAIFKKNAPPAPPQPPTVIPHDPGIAH